MARSAYRRAYDEAEYVRFRLALSAGRLHCRCGRVATSPDHDPPLAFHTHVAGSGCCRLVPSCRRCQDRQGGLIATGAVRRLPRPSRRW